VLAKGKGAKWCKRVVRGDGPNPLQAASPSILPEKRGFDEDPQTCVFAPQPKKERRSDVITQSDTLLLAKDVEQPRHCQ
jgi:hypothetical protein